MSFQIGVEIDNTRIAWVIDSDKTVSKLIKLTTLEDRQSRAVIKLYIKTGSVKQQIFTETVSGIPPAAAGEPSINMKSGISGKTLHYEIDLNGRYLLSNRIKLHRYLKTDRKWLLLLLLIPAAAVILYLMSPAFLPVTREAETSPAAQVREKEKPAAVKAPEQKVERPETPANRENPSEAKLPEKASTQVTATEPSSDAAVTERKPAEPEYIIETEQFSLSHSVYFGPDSAAISGTAASGLDDFIRQLPDRTSYEEGNFRIRIKGHCARFGTEEGRAELSRERADNVSRYILSRTSIKPDISIEGAGASEPVTLDRGQQKLNRRADISFEGTMKIKQQKLTEE